MIYLGHRQSFPGPLQDTCEEFQVSKNKSQKIFSVAALKIKYHPNKEHQKWKLFKDSLQLIRWLTLIKIKTQMNLKLYCLWRNWAVRPLLKISAIMLKYTKFKFFTFSLAKHIEKLHFLYIVVFALNSWLTQNWGKKSIWLFWSK